MMRPATEEELQNWDQLVMANPDKGNVLQCRAFGETKAKFGWNTKYMIHELDTATIAALYLTRLVPGLGEIWYSPKGPGVTSAGQLASVLKQLKGQRSVFLVKVEPELPLNMSRELAPIGLDRAPRDIQYNKATVIVDLAPSEEEILASFKQKTRYNIRLADKKGVTAEPVELTVKNMDTMYRLMQATQSRAGFYLRSKEYFTEFWKLHTEAGCGQLFFASFEGKVLAGDFVTYLGTKALYKDGGSERDSRNLMQMYALQWRVMRWLKEHGVTEYDLHGVPPTGAPSDHPLTSLMQFKTGFNPNVTEFVGTYDYPLHPAQYRLWNRIGERVATSYAFKIKRELFY